MMVDEFKGSAMFDKEVLMSKNKSCNGLEESDRDAPSCAGGCCLGVKIFGVIAVIVLIALWLAVPVAGLIVVVMATMIAALFLYNMYRSRTSKKA